VEKTSENSISFSKLSMSSALPEFPLHGIKTPSSIDVLLAAHVICQDFPLPTGLDILV
jgi:hypothetical protein